MRAGRKNQYHEHTYHKQIITVDDKDKKKRYFLI